MIFRKLLVLLESKLTAVSGPSRSQIALIAQALSRRCLRGFRGNDYRSYALFLTLTYLRIERIFLLLNKRLP